MDDKIIEIHVPLPDEESTNAELSATSMGEARAEMKNRIEQVVSGVAQGFNYAREFANTLTPILETIAKTVQGISSTMAPVVEAVRQATISFAKVVADCKIPTITEERKQKLIASHKQWGKYGWTLCPNAPYDCFNEFPTSIEEANAVMVSLCSKHEMELLFEELRSYRIKKDDLNAAILCYNSRQYKACALILFGIIDAKLIRKQNRGEKYRPSGSKAAKRVREQFEGSDSEKMLFNVLLCVNLFACLETLFANAGDFKVEPVIINRNFVSHGMSQRPVRRRDCIQLFLALYNLMFFFEFVS